MRALFNFMFGRLDREYLKIHYLRAGTAAPLLDKLRETTSEMSIDWLQHEVDSLSDYYFGQKYLEFDASLLNLGINDENVAEIRRSFWEDFIWKTQKDPLPLAIVIPDSSIFGSLTKGMVEEGLSLVRLTDRPFEIFENKPENIPEIVNFLTGVASVIHRKEREEEEESRSEQDGS